MFYGHDEKSYVRQFWTDRPRDTEGLTVIEVDHQNAPASDRRPWD